MEEKEKTMYFQEKFYEFCNMVFPDLYNIGSEIEKQTRNFFANFLIAYLSYYDKKFLMTEYEYDIGDLRLSAYAIGEIRNNLKKINRLSKLLPIDDPETDYKNVIVKHIINDLFKGLYYKEKQFIASFTNAYLFKIGYFTKKWQLEEAAGSDLEMVNNLLLVMDGLDEILENKTAPEIDKDFLREEVFI